MYSSLNAHIENGIVFLDEPIHFTGKARAIVTILEEEVYLPQNGKKLAKILGEIAKKNHSYMNTEASQWQKEIRADKNLPRND